MVSFRLSWAFLTISSWVLVFFFFWLVFLTFRLRKIRKQQNLFFQGVNAGNLAEVMADYIEKEKALEKNLQNLSQYHDETIEVLRGAVQKTAVVRFDAFDDIGGKLSFAAALLNENGDGIVISSINGRHESRTYAKPVKEGVSVYNLSKEEEEVIANAMRYHS